MLSDRESKLLRIKDLLDHMTEAHDQWAWSEEADSEMLADLMLRDVEQIKRVCVSLAHGRADRVPHRLAEPVGIV